MASNTPFHSEELAVRERAGERQIARMNSGALSDHIPDDAIAFLAQQPVAVVASFGQDDSVWASVLVGKPGFLYSEDGRRVSLDVSEPGSTADDPLWKNLRDNPQIGVLVVEFASRRRIRINGRIRSSAGERLCVEVETAYPNYPKYIQRRHWKVSTHDTNRSAEPIRRGSVLDPEHKAWIRQADTLFVASAHPEKGADASHRGGKPDFVQVLDAQRLRIPDYAGNSMFNTLGNFESFPHAGLAFIDFERGRLLQVSGRPVIR
jgi:predicted pyridoxine 5'-phosphate oxidase superfamily flavin-nucleotide-binding protein